MGSFDKNKYEFFKEQLGVLKHVSFKDKTPVPAKVKAATKVLHRWTLAGQRRRSAFNRQRDKRLFKIKELLAFGEFEAALKAIKEEKKRLL